MVAQQRKKVRPGPNEGPQVVGDRQQNDRATPTRWPSDEADLYRESLVFPRKSVGEASVMTLTVPAISRAIRRKGRGRLLRAAAVFGREGLCCQRICFRLRAQGVPQCQTQSPLGRFRRAVDIHARFPTCASEKSQLAWFSYGGVDFPFRVWRRFSGSPAAG